MRDYAEALTAEAMIFPQGQPEGRVNEQKIGVVAIFVTGSYLVNPLAHHLDQGMFRMSM